jgi:hypothetical protein
MNKEVLKHKISRKLRKAANALANGAFADAAISGDGVELKPLHMAEAYDRVAKWLEDTKTRLV